MGLFFAFYSAIIILYAPYLSNCLHATGHQELNRESLEHAEGAKHEVHNLRTVNEALMLN